MSTNGDPYVSHWWFDEDGYVRFQHTANEFRYTITPEQQGRLYEYLLFQKEQDAK